MEPDDAAELELRDYLTILRRRWLLVLLLFVFCVGAAAAGSLLQPERYASSATVILRTPQSQGLFVSVPGSGGFLTRDVVSELALVESDAYRPVASAGIEFTASNPEATSELVLQAEASTAEVAEEAAAQWAAAYLEGRHALDTETAQAAITTAEVSVAEVEALEAELLEPLEPIERAIETATDPDVISRLTTQRLSLLQALDADLFPLRSQRQSLSSELGRQRIIVRFLEETPELGARLVSVSAASDLRSPLVRNIVLGAVVGLILAAAGALLMENLRARIHSAADLARAVPSLGLLGELPLIDRKLLGPGISWDSLSEEPMYRSGLETLITSLQLLAQDRPLSSLLVTSADASTGKTSVASSLGLALSYAGQPAVLVDADLRRPRLHSLFELEDRPGLTDVLLGTCELAATVQLTSSGTGSDLKVVPCGAASNSPAELLRSPTMRDVVDSLESSCGFVVVDAPPILPVTDASLIAPTVDLTLLIVRVGVSTPEAVRRSVETLRRSNVEVAAVLIGTTPSDAYY